MPMGARMLLWPACVVCAHAVALPSTIMSINWGRHRSDGKQYCTPHPTKRSLAPRTLAHAHAHTTPYHITHTRARARVRHTTHHATACHTMLHRTTLHRMLSSQLKEILDVYQGGTAADMLETMPRSVETMPRSLCCIERGTPWHAVARGKGLLAG